ncbi:MAG: PhoH family protein [Candidatus Marinimicrobia bacterium]|nr:PhoH family protein [Candidatus Neomarinimicrobiota bacterium]MCF7829902.1 PhoH family protein [Candidatus Neomarinimicrobiota bacterium]MCF7879135.1 PhoH family protein [Candidatus Neomarinimicrobiota bacterium]
MAEQLEIPILGVEPLALLGVNDANLKVLEHNFDAKILVRGNSIRVEGDPEEVSQIESIVTEMVYTLKKKGTLDEQDVETLVRLEKSGSIEHREKGLDSVILFTKNDVIKPRTDGQERYWKDARENDIVFAIGPAGTGKTYLAVAIAVAAFKNREVSKIVLCRPAVEAGESLGFLPGDLKEKVDPYLTPLYDALYEMLPVEKLRALMDQKIIEIVPLAYMRGRTLNNAFVILDEAQNTTPLQMKMFLTRLGVNSKAIITGDITQIDLPGHQDSGLIQCQEILADVDGIKFEYLSPRDVVRHRLVKDIIRAYGDYGEENQSTT